MAVVGGRYELQTLLTEGEGRALWRGHDTVLDRAVAVLVLDADHPRAAQVRAAARQAAQVEHPGILRVIDVDVDDDRVFVVTRWLQGRTLADALSNGPLPGAAAARVVYDVADALTAAHREGVHHGVLDPRDVLLAEDSVVVVGVGVRAAFTAPTVQPETVVDPVRRDAQRLGALLYAALTARWPGSACAGLAAAPTMPSPLERPGEEIPVRPRQIRAGVPSTLDDVAWRALDPTGAEPDALTDPAAVARALSTLRREADTSPLAPRPGVAARVGWAAVVALVVVGLALLGWQFWQAQNRPPTPTATPTPAVTESPTPTPSPTVTRFAVAQAQAFDPQGDGEENDELAELAIDGDPTTAWRTVQYTSRELGGLKSGVGLRLVLPERVPVGGVELELVGRGTDLQLLTSPSRSVDLEDYSVSASVNGAGDRVTLRFAPAVRSRTVLVWLTGLPRDGDGYRGGVAEAVVLP